MLVYCVTFCCPPGDTRLGVRSQHDETPVLALSIVPFFTVLQQRDRYKYYESSQQEHTNDNETMNINAVEILVDRPII